jgi:predicted nucleic acid-binding protein
VEALAVTTVTRLAQAERLFLDSAPVIYFVERNPSYVDAVHLVFQRIDSGQLTGVTSAVTLAECLVYPYRLGRMDLVRAFSDLILSGSNTEFVVLDRAVAESAANLRARYNLPLADAFQLAAASPRVVMPS